MQKYSSLKFHRGFQFNMTPMIDVVFLLIIFFMLICQFISQENYKLVVPDDCPAAIVPDQLDRNAITVSVFPDSDDSASSTTDFAKVLYAVRSQQYDPATAEYRIQPELLVKDMANQIAREARRKKNPLVYLRADKNLRYSQVQNALLALSQASITNVQIAAYRSEQSNSPSSIDTEEE